VNDFRLTRYELELMDILWGRGEGTVQEVCDGLGRELAYTTVMTTLSLLERKKGVLERFKRGRAYVYRPLVSRQDVSRSMLTEFREVLFENRLPSLVLSVLAEEELTADDISAIRKALDDIDSAS